MQEITAKVIEHSQFEDKHIISVETRAPKFLDAEIEKHRMISSNSSSDRAIPFNRMKEIEPYTPSDIRLNESGMQGFDKLPDDKHKFFAADVAAMHNYILSTLELLDSGYNIHKQHLNRYLLPFSMQTKIMTATTNEWDYFFNLRLHEAADPAIQELAYKIQFAIDNSEPNELKEDAWHLPYITKDDKDTQDTETLLKVSAARCARTSYKDRQGRMSSVKEDLKLFERLTGSDPKHLSPLDHQAKPILNTNKLSDRGITRMNKDLSFGSGNFNNWIQFRHWYLQN